jgi:hypothetical protein
MSMDKTREPPIRYPLPYVVVDTPDVELDFNDAAAVVSWFVANGRAQREHGALCIDVTPRHVATYRVVRAFTCDVAAVVGLAEDLGWIVPRETHFRRACRALNLVPALAVPFSVAHAVACAIHNVTSVPEQAWDAAPELARRVWRHLLNKYLLDIWMACDCVGTSMVGVLHLVHTMAQFYATDAEARTIVVGSISGEPQPDRSALNPNAPPFAPGSCTSLQPSTLHPTALPQAFTTLAQASKELPHASTSHTARRLRVGVSGPPEGEDGDFFLASSTSLLYGPCTRGMWPARTIVRAVCGNAAPSPLPTAHTFLVVDHGAPQTVCAPEGGYYLDAANFTLFGPVQNGHWCAPSAAAPDAKPDATPDGAPGTTANVPQPTALARIHVAHTLPAPSPVRARVQHFMPPPRVPSLPFAIASPFGVHPRS